MLALTGELTHASTITHIEQCHAMQASCNKGSPHAVELRNHTNERMSKMSQRFLSSWVMIFVLLGNWTECIT